jgi:predicted ATPase
LEQGLRLYDAQKYRAHAFLYGQDPGVVCLSFMALTLWLLGYPDQALARSNEALNLARDLAHPLSLVLALDFAAGLHQFRREAGLTQEHAEALVRLATEQGLPFWGGTGTVKRGWALVEQGQGEEGIGQMHQGLAAVQSTSTTLVRPSNLGRLAEAYGKVERLEEELRVLNEALVQVHQSGERYYEAELHRLQGEAWLRHAVPDVQQAETCLRQALAVARHQQTKSLELRATMSLARLWQRQGKRTEARQLLAEVYGWFTEGFETADLREAGSLLTALAS